MVTVVVEEAAVELDGDVYPLSLSIFYGQAIRAAVAWQLLQNVFFSFFFLFLELCVNLCKSVSLTSHSVHVYYVTVHVHKDSIVTPHPLL